MGFLMTFSNMRILKSYSSSIIVSLSYLADPFLLPNFVPDHLSCPFLGIQ